MLMVLKNGKNARSLRVLAFLFLSQGREEKLSAELLLTTSVIIKHANAVKPSLKKRLQQKHKKMGLWGRF